VEAAEPAAPVRGRSTAAPRCAILSTIALLGVLFGPAPARPALAFAWAALAVTAMVLEFSARRTRRR
jgi:hypothetical protein